MGAGEAVLGAGEAVLGAGEAVLGAGEVLGDDRTCYTMGYTHNTNSKCNPKYHLSSVGYAGSLRKMQLSDI